MCLVRVHLEHGGGEEAGHGGVLLLHADLELVNVVVVDGLAGVVRETDKRSALAVAGSVGGVPYLVIWDVWDVWGRRFLSTWSLRLVVDWSTGPLVVDL